MALPHLLHVDSVKGRLTMLPNQNVSKPLQCMHEAGDQLFNKMLSGCSPLRPVQEPERVT